MRSITKSILEAGDKRKTGRDSSYVLEGKYVKVLAEGRTGPYNPTELDILSRVVHEGVLPCDLISSSTNDVRGMSFATEVCQDTLTSWLMKRRSLHQKIEVCLKLLRVVEFLHSSGIAHLDIKPDNIMIGSDGSVFLIDYGSARYTECCPPTVLLSSNWAKTTPEYRAPEILSSREEVIRTGSMADVWSLALVLLTILSGGYRVYPEDVLGSRDQLNKYIIKKFPTEKKRIIRYLLKIGNCYDNNLEDLFSMMFSYTPENRPTVSKILGYSIWMNEEKNEGSIVAPVLERKKVESQVVNSVVKCFSRELKEVSIQSLLHAVDLLYRVGESENVTLAACCWIALKSCFGHNTDNFSKILEYFDTPNGTQVLQEEERIILLFEGVLIETLYGKCRDRRDLTTVLENVVYDYETYKTFSSSKERDVLEGENSKLCLVKDIL